ncbi:hypothetical protein [Pseudomonas sp. URMO17WK12:I11]|uniref:hypothetical protein n=1 Tax=Pseudomonas sp. URMO17WK12:I11 TaxID=1283291 RepID=UPI00072214F0|nr:hypothetical protein [Pseudomonas sp. URMO17WK12:I11]CRL47370.1 hypothetical protein PSHI_03930 [Pseudomonas sp. URMO17WK12:I11]
MHNNTFRTALALIIFLIQTMCMAQEQLPSTDNQIQAQQNTNSLIAKIRDLDGQVEALKKKSEETSASAIATMVTAPVALIVALIAGVFAIIGQRNQAELQRDLTATQAQHERDLTTRQAEQERLLKAIELIMQSRNIHEARIRVKNLEPFLTLEVNAHLNDMLEKHEDDNQSFSTPEWTDIRIKVGETMVAKAKDAEEVLKIWQLILAKKGVLKDVKWPPSDESS